MPSYKAEMEMYKRYWESTQAELEKDRRKFQEQIDKLTKNLEAASEKLAAPVRIPQLLSILEANTYGKFPELTALFQDLIAAEVAQLPGLAAEIQYLAAFTARHRWLMSPFSGQIVPQ